MTDAFLPLAVAQAQARGGNLRMVPVTHPVGGLRAEELASRVDQVVAALQPAPAMGSPT